MMNDELGAAQTAGAIVLVIIPHSSFIIQ